MPVGGMDFHLFGCLIRFHLFSLSGLRHTENPACLQPIHVVASKRLLVGLEQCNKHLLQADTLRFQSRSDTRQIFTFPDRTIGFPDRFTFPGNFRFRFFFCQQLLVQGNIRSDFRLYSASRRIGRLSRNCRCLCGHS